jgi:hypothetical protein
LPIKLYKGKSESISNVCVKINKTAIYNSQAHHFSTQSQSFAIHFVQCCKSLCISLEKEVLTEQQAVYDVQLIVTGKMTTSKRALRGPKNENLTKCDQGYIIYVPVSQSITAGVLSTVWAEYG